MKSDVYLLAPNCKIVKGFTNSILLDLQRNTYRLLSLNLISILEKPIELHQLESLSNNDNVFFRELIQENVLIQVPYSTLDNFKSLKNDYYNSTPLNNFIIELSSINLSKTDEISTSLDQLGCKFMEVRVEPEISIKELFSFLSSFRSSTVQSIDIFFKYRNSSTELGLKELKNNFREIRWIFIYETPEELVTSLNASRAVGFLFIKQKVDKSNCGNISSFYFSVNIPTYTESMHYNSCLNCKMSLSANGEIRSCPSMATSYGNIQIISLEKAIKDPLFLKYGKIRKDEINICRDCEYRYICTDCRAFIEDPNDMHSKPLKCGYDPYRGVWENWSTNPLKQKSIDYYKLNTKKES